MISRTAQMSENEHSKEPRQPIFHVASQHGGQSQNNSVLSNGDIWLRRLSFHSLLQGILNQLSGLVVSGVDSVGSELRIPKFLDYRRLVIHDSNSLAIGCFDMDRLIIFNFKERSWRLLFVEYPTLADAGGA